ncbi:MAG: hypothetical protein V7K91_22040 [Nostoc sp.]
MRRRCIGLRQRMIATKEGNSDNIPELMLAYLNKLNCDRLETESDNLTVQKDTKVIAW